jgi:opacity protein-like surface antigen
MKKLSTAACVVASLMAASTAHAAWEYNFLLGLSGGYAARDGDVDITIFHPAPGSQISAAIRDIEDDGFIGGLFGGYQARCNGWLFGAELAVDWEDTDSDRAFAFTDILNRGWSGSAHYDRETLVGLTARGGYEISPYLMPYIRLGAEWSRDKLAYSMATANNLLFASGDGRRTVTRFIGGVGIEMPIPIMAGLSFRAEYNYHSKGKSVEAASLANDGATLVVADSKPRTNSGKVSLVWNFL